MSSDNGACREGNPPQARAPGVRKGRPGVGALKGTMARHPGPGELAAPRRFFLPLLGPWPGTPLQAPRCPRAPGAPGDWRGALAEEGGMVWREGRRIQHKHPGDCGGGERGSLGRHLSLVHREEKDTIYKAVRL